MSTLYDPRRLAVAVEVAPSEVAPAEVGSAPAPAASRTQARALSWVDRLTLVAIGLVVVVVTLPVLRRFGLRENERDAVRMLRVLAAAPAPAGAKRPADLGALAQRDRQLARRLEDLEVLDDGRLRRHGYLFDVARLATGEPVLLAWPWEHAQTGRAAFAWSPRRGLVGHRNEDGRYSGPAAAPEPGDFLASGWVAVPRR